MNALNKKEIELIENAKKNEYLRVQKNYRMDLKNTFFNYCKKYDKPLLMLIEQGEYATIEIDLITTIYNFTDATLDELSNVSQDYTHSLSLNSIGSIYCSFSKVPIDKAESFALKLLSIYTPLENRHSIS